MTEPPPSQLPRFSRADCTVFARYPQSLPWNDENVRPDDQKVFKDIRERLKKVAGLMVRDIKTSVPLRSFTSLYQANGRSQQDIWCCAYPAAAPNKSYALQAALIISARGAEICLCVPAGTSGLKADALAEAEKALSQLRSRLASVPPDVVAALGRLLPKRAAYRKSWRQRAGSAEFDSLAEWLAYAAGPDGATASISVYLDELALENTGPGLTDLAVQFATATLPLFEYCYSPEPPGIATPSAERASLVSRLDSTLASLGAVEPGAEEPGASGASAAYLAGAMADTVPEPGEGRVQAADRLGIRTDVNMLVSVLLARDTPMPLAIGLFGDWGSGKSFFMALMHERISELARFATEGRPEARPYCQRVRLVRFNAWHYVDTNLWASLASTLFDKLALANRPDGAKAKEAELGQAEEEAAAARAERWRLEDEVATLAAAADRPVARLAGLLAGVIHAARADPDLIQHLRSAAQGQADTSQQADQLAEALGQIDSTARKTQAAWRLFREEVLHRKRGQTLLILAVLVVAAIAGSVVATVPAAVKAVAFAAAVAVSLAPALTATIRVLHLAGEVREAREARELPLVQKRAELDRAQAREAEAALKVAERVKELARLRDKGARLQEFVRKRAASSDYRGKLGVISKIRRDFEELARLLEEDRPAGIAGPAGEQVPDVERIVLFVDDLDRCPQDKVVEVLQAVHLLLAFRLFVVVVGVDSRWLEHSLKAHYQNLLEEPDSYLEKIFQIPFMLRRMTLDTYQGLINELTTPLALNLSLDQDEDEQGGEEGDLRAEDFPGTGSGSAPADSPAGQDAPESGDLAGSGSLPSPQALVISDAERKLLGYTGALVPTPRAAKRLVNIYRMLRVSVADRELDAFLPSGDGECQAVVLLLGILVGRPDQANDVFAALETADDTDSVWDVLSAFADLSGPLATLRDSITVTQAGPYRRWVPRVARFSFRFGQMQLSRSAPGHAARSDPAAASGEPFQTPLTGQNCTVVMTDVADFGAGFRTDEDRLVIREALWRMTSTAMGRIWASAWMEDRGDGQLIVVRPDVPTSAVMACLVNGLPSLLRQHNRDSPGIQFKLRAAVDVGPMSSDTMGLIGEATITTARLVDGPSFKAELAGSPASLGVITSAFVYETTIRHDSGLGPLHFMPIQVAVKELSATAWMRLI